MHGEQIFDALSVVAAHQRHADRVGAGRDRERGDARTAPRGRQRRDALAVEREIHVVVAPRGDLEFVLGIEWEHVLHLEAAARAERLAVDVVAALPVAPARDRW